MRRKEVNMHLARILVREGHTQEEIARRLGVTDATIRNYLNRSEKTRPRKQRISKLESYYAIIDDALEEKNPYTNLVVLMSVCSGAVISAG